PVPTGKPKVKPVHTGKPKVTPVPTGKPKVTPIPTGKPQVSTPVPTGRTNRPFPVPTDRGYFPSETPFSATEDEGIFDSGCSRTMTGNKERLDNFQAFHGGKVTFGVGEERITRKGTIGTPILDFENVYYVKELQQFNLFSISQICDKKNQVLFTDTECLVLSKDFKLPDDSMVVLRVPRKHNLYTINLNDLCPRGNLACLVAHASFDESMKWNRRMAHVNYKNMNSPHNKTPYALLTGNIPAVSHFKPFGCHVTILNISDHLGKFDEKSDEGYIVGYSASNNAYRVYNVPNKRVEESMNLLFFEEKPNVQGLGHEWYFDLDYLTDSLVYKYVTANQHAGKQGATTNSASIQADDSDSDYDEQVIIVPSYPSHIIQGTQPIDTPGDKVDDSSFQSTDEIFHKELARLKIRNNDATPVSPGRIHVPTGKVPVPTGSLPVPAGNIPIPVPTTLVPSDDVLVHTSSSTDSMVDGEHTTRYHCPSDLGNHNPSPGIFSSSSYDDEFDAALNNVASSVEVSPVATKRINTIHPQSLIIGDPIFVRDNHTDFQHCLFACFLSQVKLRSVAQSLEDPSWVDAMQEEMQRFKFQNVWVLVDLPAGHRKEEGIDYDEVFAPMDIKSAFLYGRIDEEVYVINLKVLWILHISRRSTRYSKLYMDFIKLQELGRVSNECYGETYLLPRIETTPYEAPKPKSKSESDSLVNVHLYRSMIGSLMYLTASRPDIMFAVSACSRHQVTPTTLNLEAVKKIFKYLKGQPKLGLWYPKELPFVLEAYSDSDYVGSNKDRKSTTAGYTQEKDKNKAQNDKTEHRLEKIGKVKVKVNPDKAEAEKAKKYTLRDWNYQVLKVVLHANNSKG
nr:ribonuclease H-like domain-containing protein [Tanacetum cinerariifolium]